MGINKSTDDKRFVGDKGEKNEKKDTLETETLNDILNELKTLNNNFKTIEKTMKSRQPMYQPMYPMQQSNPLTNILNNIDLEKVLKTWAVISELYKSENQE